MLGFTGAWLELLPNVPAICPAPADGEVVFTLWSLGRVEGAAPELHRIRFHEGRAVESTIGLIDWGDVVEADAGPRIDRNEPPAQPRLLSSADFYYKEARAKAELYLDGGLRLCISPERAEAFSIPLGEGTGGSLRTVDMGREVMLAVLGETGDGMRLLMLNKDAETLLNEEGSRAEISGGLPTVIQRLESRRGLERRLRYELSQRGFVKTEDELGFFTRPENAPKTDAETALCFFEELLLGYEEGWRKALSGQIAGAGEKELREFIGGYSKAAVYPLEEPLGSVTAGVFGEGETIVRPSRFRLVFGDGIITDIVGL